MDSEKNNFLAKITHDLRTPVGAIIGVLQLLKKNTILNDKQAQYVNIMNTCSEQLLCLINDILNLSKCKNGKMKISNNCMSIKECLEEVFDMNYTKASEKNLNLSYAIDKSVPLYIKSDSKKLKQILMNLISNSIKFTNTGSIVLHVYTDNKNFNNNIIKINFSVYDTGIGIPKQNINSIFNSFEQVENDYNRTIVGSGLGLSICKEFVSLLGGSIGVNSEEGKGSEFFFNIKASCINENKNFLKNKHVLLIDDKTINRILYKSMFQELDMKTSSFPCGTRALEYIKDNKIDIAFIDIHLPYIDGINIAQQIKKINNDILLLSISADITMQNSEWIHTEKNVFAKNLYTPIDKNKISKILIELLTDTNNTLKRRKSNRYSSPKRNNEKSPWFEGKMSN